MQWNYDGLLQLQDYELIMKARDAVIDEIRNSSSEEELEKIPEIRFFLITASIFDMEMQNGGLCQFLVNQGMFHGPMLENALIAFGAEQHGRMVATFCREQGIDLSNLEELIPKTTDSCCMTENYIRLIKEYPFADFHKAYFEIDRECPLERILGKYIRNDITLFFGN